MKKNILTMVTHRSCCTQLLCGTRQLAQTSNDAQPFEWETPMRLCPERRRWFWSSCHWPIYWMEKGGHEDTMVTFKIRLPEGTWTSTSFRHSLTSAMDTEDTWSIPLLEMGTDQSYAWVRDKYPANTIRQHSYHYGAEPRWLVGLNLDKKISLH